jgi:hypothetical protein
MTSNQILYQHIHNANNKTHINRDDSSEKIMFVLRKLYK